MQLYGIVKFTYLNFSIKNEVYLLNNFKAMGFLSSFLPS